MSEPVELLIYSKPECHLCDEMKEVIKAVSENRRIELEEIDITSDRELEMEFSEDIPVLVYGETILARHRITEKALSDKIAELTRGA